VIDASGDLWLVTGGEPSPQQLRHRKMAEREYTNPSRSFPREGFVYHVSAILVWPNSL
jgi:hypothetical protein